MIQLIHTPKFTSQAQEAAYCYDLAKDLILKELPILEFKPWFKQNEITRTDKTWRLLAWANRTGKTTEGAFEIVTSMMGWHKYIPFPKPPWTGWATSVDNKQMQDSIIPALEGDSTHPRMLPDIEMCRLNQQKLTYKLPHPCRYTPTPTTTLAEMEQPGSILRLKSAASGRKPFQGAAVPMHWWDEELPVPIIKEMILRLPPGYVPYFLWTMTAVEGLGYAFDNLYLPWLAWQSEQEEKPENKREPHPSIHISVASMEEAPHISDEQIAMVVSSFPADSKELKVRLHGGFHDVAADSVFSSEAISYHRKRCIPPLHQLTLAVKDRFWDMPTSNWAKGSDLIESYKYDKLQDDWYANIWRMPQRGHNYVGFADTSEGKSVNPLDQDSPKDYNCIVILDRTTKEFVAEVHNRLDPHSIGEVLWMLGHWYNYAWVSPEINSSGLAALGILTGKGKLPAYSRLYQRLTDFDEWNPEIANDDLGWRTTAQNKGMLIADFYTFVEPSKAGSIVEAKIYSEGCVREMKSFQRNLRTGQAGAISGYHDDRIISYAGATHLDIHCPSGTAVRVNAKTGTPRGGVQSEALPATVIDGGKYTRRRKAAPRVTVGRKRRR